MEQAKKEQTYLPEIVFVPGLVGATHDTNVILAWAGASLPKRARSINAHIHGVISRMSPYIEGTSALIEYLGGACGVTLALPPVVRIHSPEHGDTDPEEVEGQKALSVEEAHKRLRLSLIRALTSYEYPTDNSEVNAWLAKNDRQGKLVQHIADGKMQYTPMSENPSKLEELSQLLQPDVWSSDTMPSFHRHSVEMYEEQRPIIEMSESIGGFRLHPVFELLSAWDIIKPAMVIHALRQYVCFREWEDKTVPEPSITKYVSIEGPSRTQVPDMRPHDPRASL